MYSIIKQWLKRIKVNKKDILYYLLLSVLEIVCYLFLPISYANIATKATQQNFQLTYLWAAINFLVQILNIITLTAKRSFINFEKTRIKTNLTTNHPDTKLLSSNIADFLSSFNNFFMLVLKLVAILVSASIYSLYLSFYIFIAILICIILSYFIQKSSLKRLENFTLAEQINLKLTNLKTTVIDVVWIISTFVITLITIDLINNQEISLTIFLLLTTFVNTHLIRPNFNISIISDIRIVKKCLDSYSAIVHTKKSE